MFGRLFAEGGLSLDRLRVLVEVGAGGSIVRAAPGDPVRQSQYSRQLKELEDFFQVALVERHGKSIRLTASGRELARISRFFLLGLANFQRGCRAEAQNYRLGGGATFHHIFLLPLLAEWAAASGGQIRFEVEHVARADMERRLHELTLDFGIITDNEVSRPLQTRLLGRCRLDLWVPKALFSTARAAEQARAKHLLPWAFPVAELDSARLPGFDAIEPTVVCQTFIEARTLVEAGKLAAWLPRFLPPNDPQRYHRLSGAGRVGVHGEFHLAWNPRLLRLNPHAARRRDALVRELSRSLAQG